MTEDFNIRSSSWDSLFPHYSVYQDILMDIVDSMNLCISKSTNQVLTGYLDNSNDSSTSCSYN